MMAAPRVSSLAGGALLTFPVCVLACIMPDTQDEQGFWDRKLNEDPEFRDLLAKWDAELARSGFVDIEQRGILGGREGAYLTGSISTADAKRRWKSQERRAAKEEYYALARAKVHEIENRRENVCWELHSEGLSEKKVLSRMKSMRFKVTLGWVKKCIAKYAAEIRSSARHRPEDPK